ncbi:MAG TPA: RNA 3'-terminal phosphate cyclase, partial [Blastocatellia bacterium]|nr:RNA 3'-terminal phosphate cyclase [Blastocatellia bacterium]
YSAGNAVMIEIESDHLTEVVTRLGERGVRAETVAELAAAEARDYLESGAPVGEHLADQLLIPLALARGGSFVTLRPSLHTTTNIEVIRKFLDIAIEILPLDDNRWRIDVGGKTEV